MTSIPMQRIREAGRQATSTLPAAVKSCVSLGRQHPVLATTAMVAVVTAVVCSICFSRR